MNKMKIFNRIIILSLAVIMVSCGIDDSKKYVLTPDQTLQSYLNKEDIITPEKLSNLLLCKKDSNTYQFIDLRTPHDFAIKHLKNAINIPAKDILDPGNIEVLNQDTKINVFYGYGASDAINSYLILKQLNYKNLRVALGGYDFVDQSILASFGIKTGVYDDEKPRFDFIRLVAAQEGPKFDSIKAPKGYKLNPNVVVKDFDEECPDLN